MTPASFHNCVTSIVPHRFKITTSDICERFKLALFLLLILLLNCFQGEVSESMVKEYYTMCLIVMVAELISDWIKHSFITKFNFIKSSAYFDYALILSGDVTGIGHEDLNLDYTHAAVKRVGLAQIPLVCVTARYLHEALRFTIAFRGNGDVEHPMKASLNSVLTKYALILNTEPPYLWNLHWPILKRLWQSYLSYRYGNSIRVCFYSWLL